MANFMRLQLSNPTEWEFVPADAWMLRSKKGTRDTSVKEYVRIELNTRPYVKEGIYREPTAKVPLNGSHRTTH
jgi:hypothetical protein